MSLIRRAFERRGADPTQPWGDSSIPPPTGATFSSGGLQIDERTAMSIMTVYSCVAILADSVATLPLDTFVRRGPHRISVDPAPTVTLQPWPEITLQDWLSQLMYSLALRGNFYGYITERDELLRATAIMPLHPDQVRVTRDTNPNSARFGRRVYHVNGGEVDPDDIWHVPALTAPGALIGLNPLEFARGGLTLAAATEKYGTQFFANSAHASGTLSTEQKLPEDQTKAMARSWASAHQGIGKAHMPAVLTGGVKWTAISISPEDAQALQTRTYQAHEIASFFRVPEHMLGMQDRTSSWGTGIEQMELGFVTNTLRPWLSRVEGKLNELLAPGQYVKFNLAGRLRGDTLQRFQAYTLARNGGWMNIDEIRDREDQEPLPDGIGTDYLQPLNFVPIGSAPADPVPPGSDERAAAAAKAFMADAMSWRAEHPKENAA